MSSSSSSSIPTSATLPTASPTLVIDGHNDLPWRLRKNANSNFNQLEIRNNLGGHTDIARLRKGGVGAQFWSVFVPTDLSSNAVKLTLEQIDIVHRMIARYPDTFMLATSSQDIKMAFSQGKIASLIGMEGGHSMNNSLAVLRMLYRLGARYMTLTHNGNNHWADSGVSRDLRGCYVKSTPWHNGLTDFGMQTVLEMNRIGMLIDLSHVSHETMRQAINTSLAPVIFSHSSVFAISQTHRNVPDDVLLMLKLNQGIIMITFVETFICNKARQYWNTVYEKLDGKEPENEEEARKLGLSPYHRSTMQQVADHIDYVRELIGVEYIGIGGDFDGCTDLPTDLDDVSKYPNLKQELLKRGYSQYDIDRIFHLNLLRVFEKVEHVRDSLIHQPPNLSKL